MFGLVCLCVGRRLSCLDMSLSQCPFALHMTLVPQLELLGGGGNCSSMCISVSTSCATLVNDFATLHESLSLNIGPCSLLSCFRAVDQLQDPILLSCATLVNDFATLHESLSLNIGPCSLLSCFRAVGELHDSSRDMATRYLVSVCRRFGNVVPPC